ncbi:hypothetical protein [Mycobacteroides abscessus]|uniref:hypothetical protein n=1 Tax=Mycobacteroides abscessus TaxID=36809 RepID=UPI0005E96B0C|nr:hypothetical protein [Mycobacteroides abscessus]CPR78965.1 Uncharacterised protein [Mycobacteroides abscessus]CPR88126.1 Uncharacterised protein [Mycobacteroides abscessus]CPS43120.1 Uncharacterised protein [Mycobacteroides abscessus]CPV02888.1 Uncharacterised protein [Mycobacteroides abscessus]
MTTWRVFIPHDGPCVCWTGPVVIHEGGCCFHYPPTDDDELGVPPPCGHWHPAVGRPNRVSVFDLTSEQALAHFTELVESGELDETKGGVWRIC